MLFLIFLSYQLIKIINKDRYLPNYGKKVDTKEHLNLQISSPKDQIQEINLADYPNIKIISIYEESNVIISCLQSTIDIQQMYFNIFGKPTIAFNNSCHFSNLKIFDSPTFHLMQNSSFLVDSLILYNKEYQFPFPFKHVHYSQNDVNKAKRTVKRYDDVDFFNMECHYILNFALNNSYATVECDDYDPIRIFYQNMYKHSFKYRKSIINIVNNSAKKNDIHSYLKKIFDSIEFTGNFFEPISEKEKEKGKLAYFINFDDDNNFTSFINIFPGNTNFFAKLSKKYKFWCQNRSVSNADNLKVLFDFGWKPLCLSNEPYINYVLTNKAYEIKFISKKTYITLVAVVVAIVLVFLASIVLIVFCRFSSHKKKAKISAE